LWSLSQIEQAEWVTQRADNSRNCQPKSHPVAAAAAAGREVKNSREFIAETAKRL
jgi:hypothetical protein